MTSTSPIAAAESWSVRTLQRNVATKYRLCLPSDEDLRREIETQKRIFVDQHAEA